jgi:hypothetical protein
MNLSKTFFQDLILFNHVSLVDVTYEGVNTMCTWCNSFISDARRTGAAEKG